MTSKPTSATPAAPILVEREGAYSLLLRAAFDQICDKQDWKAPVNALVPWEAANIYMDAVTYMTAVRPDCNRVVKEGVVYGHITCVGYRMGPAGDH